MITLNFNLVPNLKFELSVNEEMSVKDLRQILIHEIRKKQPELEHHEFQLAIYCGKEIQDHDIVKNVDWSECYITIHKEHELELESDAGSDTSSSESEIDSEELAEEAEQLIGECEKALAIYKKFLIWANNPESMSREEFQQKLKEKSEHTSQQSSSPS
jgi:hypothetical protein